MRVLCKTPRSKNGAVKVKCLNLKRIRLLLSYWEGIAQAQGIYWTVAYSGQLRPQDPVIRAAEVAVPGLVCVEWRCRCDKCIIQR